MNKLTLAMDPSAPDGLYTVEYNACRPDESCHDGNFQFAIDRSLSGAFDDQRGDPEVSVVLVDITIKPQKHEAFFNTLSILSRNFGHKRWRAVLNRQKEVKSQTCVDNSSAELTDAGCSVLINALNPIQVEIDEVVA
ncbi:MAG: hypothetical protein QME41_04070 [Actinomycetota bacterium]|nr:hypothetical protein [Actinomycetota bacterium]